MCIRDEAGSCSKRACDARVPAHARRWGIANAERMMVRADQLQLSALLSRKGNSGEVWRGTLWGKQVRALRVNSHAVEQQEHRGGVERHAVGHAVRVLRWGQARCGPSR